MPGIFFLSNFLLLFLFPFFLYSVFFSCLFHFLFLLLICMVSLVSIACLTAFNRGCASRYSICTASWHESLTSTSQYNTLFSNFCVSALSIIPNTACLINWKFHPTTLSNMKHR